MLFRRFISNNIKLQNQQNIFIKISKMSASHQPSRQYTVGSEPQDVAQVHPNAADRPQLPDLNPDQKSMSEYWNKRWEVNAINWKIHERKLGDELYIKNINNLLHNQKEEESSMLKFDRFFDPKHSGIEVFVPLCGDTGLLAFLFQTGFNVTGIDVAEKALRNVMQEASSNLPAGYVVEWNEKEIKDPSTGVTKMKIFVGKSFSTDDNDKNKSLSQITLICGDFFEAPLDVSTNNQGFDIIYDRASGVAMPPALREQYFNKILSCCMRREKRNEDENGVFKHIANDVGTCIYFSIMQRSTESKAKNAGPPFFFSPDELSGKYYTKERNFDMEVLEFPTEEEAAQNGGGQFMEGVAQVYQKF